ncbi:MAG TPA: hypothetical protein VD866_30170 [Urbifossiella sp.]|nr:hypothetical protein [Urbifossiella sp.]
MAAQTEEFKKKERELDRLVHTTYGLLGGAALGLVAVVVLMVDRTKIAGLLFLIAFAIPLALLGDPKVIIFTFGLGFAALFAVLARPRRVKPVRSARRDDEDDDVYVD